MCLLVDANLAAAVFARPPHADFSPVLGWLEKGDGCVVYGGRLATELDRVGEGRRFLRSLLQAGRARLLPERDIDAEETVVAGTDLCRSDDPHILALARVSGARTLCTHDRNLQRDFRNSRLISAPRGSIYQRPEHSRLLRHTGSCGLLQRRRRK